MQVRKLGLPAGLTVALVALLGIILFFPGETLAWSNCDLNGGTVAMQVGDIAAQPDGTIYAIIADANNNISVRKFSSGNCSSSSIGLVPSLNANAQDVDTNGGTGAQPEGPTEAFDPKIGVTADGEVVITYRDQGTAPYTVYYQRKPAGASNFENPVAVTTDGYVGGVAIDNDKNVHVVWYRSGGTPGGFYRKYNANDNLVVQTKTLTSFNDAEPEVAVDSVGDAHVVYMTGTSTHNDVRYRRVTADGSMDNEVDIANTGGHSIYPDIAVGPDDSIHMAWQGRASDTGFYEPYYRKCNSGATNCQNQKHVASTDTNSAAVDVTACGSGPYVSWADADGGSNHIWISENLGGANQIAGGLYHASDNAAGYVHILYRNSSGKASYSRQADDTCTGSDPVTPTDTPTVTNTPTITETPTITNTPTDGPSPTPTDTPSATNTPTATPTTGTKTYYDDKSNSLNYSGTWSTQSGSPACLYKGTFHYADGKPANKVSLDFYGTRVNYWYVQYSSMGKTKVLIDGQVVALVDLRGSGNLDCKSWLSSRLPLGNHNIQLIPRKGGRISLDVLTIFP